MLATWSLVWLPFPNPAWTSGSSQFMYCWSLAWRILSITLLACEMSAIVLQFEHSLALPSFTNPHSHLRLSHRKLMSPECTEVSAICHLSHALPTFCNALPTSSLWWNVPGPSSCNSSLTTSVKYFVLARGEGGGRGWGGWMASPAQWTWVRTNSGR